MEEPGRVPGFFIMSVQPEPKMGFIRRVDHASPVHHSRAPTAAPASPLLAPGAQPVDGSLGGVVSRHLLHSSTSVRRQGVDTGHGPDPAGAATGVDVAGPAIYTDDGKKMLADDITAGNPAEVLQAKEG